METGRPSAGQGRPQCRGLSVPSKPAPPAVQVPHVTPRASGWPAGPVLSLWKLVRAAVPRSRALPPLRPRARAARQGAAGPGESVPGGTRSVHTPAPPPTPTGHAAGAVLSGAGTRVSPVGWARPFSPALVTLERGERQGHQRGRVLEATALAPELFPSSAVCSSASAAPPRFECRACRHHQ